MYTKSEKKVAKELFKLVRERDDERLQKEIKQYKCDTPESIWDLRDFLNRLMLQGQRVILLKSKTFIPDIWKSLCFFCSDLISNNLLISFLVIAHPSMYIIRISLICKII